MKRNRKGFSLVELIVVLVIMAIIAALCAPNISAYVQAAKVQNYQTVANNLADELQTQLPQSRYWNWDEVQRNAYGILCSDAGRGVTLDTEKSTDNQKVYQITGASSDANAVFTVSLTYHDAVKTSQKVDIAVSCDGYAAVQSVQECNLVLKTNYTDASLYQEISMPNPNRDESGWKPMKNMAGTYEYWETYNSEHKEHDFMPGGHSNGVVDFDPNAFYLNLTDYPAGTVEQVTFTLQKYFITKKDISSVKKYYIKDNGDIIFPQWWWTEADRILTKDNTDGKIYEVQEKRFEEYEYTYSNVYPKLTAQVSTGTGQQKTYIDNRINTDLLEIYVGNETWVKYSDVFNVEQSDSLKSTNEAELYKEYYNDKVVDCSKNGSAYKSSDDKGNIYVKYRTNLPDSTRGWLYITGMLYGHSDGIKINPLIDDSLQVYVNYHRTEEYGYDARPVLYKWGYKDTNTNQGRDLYLDISKCGYRVNDVLKIKLSNVNSTEFINNYRDSSYFSISTMSSRTSGTLDFNAKFEKWELVSVEKDKNEPDTIIIKVKMTWDLYPYLYLSFKGEKDNFVVDAHIEMEWESGGSSSGDPIATYTPMLTLNGDSTYTNITLDWTKCDYITNVGEVGVKFAKYPSTLNYDVYSKDYTLLAPDQNLKTFMMNSNNAVTSAALADKIVHLYCKGVSPEEIQCEIVAPKNTATTTTTTTTITTTTTTTTTATTTTTTTTTAATTSTAATTATTATAATTTAETTASSTATATTSATETTAATTTTSATTSTTISTTVTTATTSTSATETSGGVVTSVIENASYNQEITIPNYKNVDYIEVKYGKPANPWVQLHWSYGGMYGQGVSSEDMQNGMTIISVENPSEKLLLKPSNMDLIGELISVTVYYKTDSTISSAELLIHYIYDDPEYSIVHILHSDGNISGIPNYGNAVTYTKSEDVLITFNDDYGVLHIFPKYNNNDVSISGKPSQLEQTKQCGWCTYHITTKMVTDGLHEIWIKNGVVYKANPDTPLAQMVNTVYRENSIAACLPKSVEVVTTTTTTTAPQTTTTTTTTTPPIAASENGKNVGLDESSAAGCNITFSDPLFNDSGVCYFTITPKAGYTLSDSYTVKVGTEVLSAKNNYNAKTGQWFFWSNKIMTDYTIHVEGVSPAA